MTLLKLFFVSAPCSIFLAARSRQADSVAHLRLPTVVFACKSDLKCQVEPKQANTVLEQYDSGLIEVNTTSSGGKEKIRMAFDWMFKAIFTNKREYQ